MISKPSFKTELAIEFRPEFRWITLWAMTPDAEEFVRGLSEFGNVYFADSHWSLKVFPSYDFDEVLKYVQSYNDSDN